MNRFLGPLNLVGVLVLSGICILQWQTNRQSHLERVAQTKAHYELLAKVEEQTGQIRDSNADRDRFRDQLTKVSGSWKETGEELAALRRERAAWLVEREMLKSNIVAWTEAVAARDGRIKEANLSVERVARERNERIEAFNRLAEKHNATVQRLNEALAKLVELRTNSPVTPKP
jgi:chromosome segregation ATPase